jgi:hypothetical protein
MWLWAVTGYVGAWAFEKLTTRIERSVYRCKLIFLILLSGKMMVIW